MSFEDSKPAIGMPTRVPPNDSLAEEATIGTLINGEEGVLDLCSQIISSDPEAFYDIRHQAIFRGVLALSDSRQPVSLITLNNHLDKHGTLSEAGGIGYLAEISGKSAGAFTVSYYLKIVAEKWKARQLIKVAGEAVERAYQADGEEIDQTIDKLGSWTIKCGMSEAAGERPLGEILNSVIDEMQRQKSGIYEGVIPTGIIDFDRRFRGITRKEMTVIAGRPSAGKTALMLQMCLNILHQGIPVGIVSLEMTSESLLMRMSGALAGLPMLQIQSFKDAHMSKLAGAVMRIKGYPLVIRDQSSLTIRQIQSVARNWVVKHKIKVLMVDYLQHVAGSSKRGREDRTQEVAEISTGLKGLAKDLDLAVVVLAQLNRDVEKRGGRPKLSDLKESGAIEQDADKVLFLWYGKEDDEGGDKAAKLKQQIDEKPKDNPVVTISNAKNRNGPTGDVYVQFEKPTQRFLAIAKEHNHSLEDHP